MGDFLDRLAVVLGVARVLFGYDYAALAFDGFRLEHDGVAVVGQKR